MNKTEEISHDGNVHHFSWTCGGVDGLLQHYKVDSMGKCTMKLQTQALYRLTLLQDIAGRILNQISPRSQCRRVHRPYKPVESSWTGSTDSRDHDRGICRNSISFRTLSIC